MDTDTDTIEHLQPAPPQGVKRFFRFSLRSLFWAITFWSVLVVVFTRLGLVEALEAVLALTALLVLDDLVPPRIQRRTPQATGFVDGAPRAGHAAGSRHRPCRDTWQRIMDLAGHNHLDSGRSADVSRAVGSPLRVSVLRLALRPGTTRHVPARGRVEFVAVGQCVAVATRTATAVTTLCPDARSDTGRGWLHTTTSHRQS